MTSKPVVPIPRVLSQNMFLRNFTPFSQSDNSQVMLKDFISPQQLLLNHKQQGKVKDNAQRASTDLQQYLN